MKIPTTAELDALFLKWGDEKFDKEMTADVQRLYKEARSSERIKGIGLGFCQSMLQGVTAAGLNLGPVLSVFLMGFRMGASYAEQQCGPDTNVMDEWLKGLDTSLPPEETL